MANSYFLPIQKNHDFIKAKVYNLQKDRDFELLSTDVASPIFDKCYTSEDREMIIYVANPRKNCSIPSLISYRLRYMTKMI